MASSTVAMIRKHVYDLLAADGRLLLGGQSYAPNGIGVGAWGSAQRNERGGVPAAGVVNLYETGFEKDGTDHRPAIYCGSRGFGSSSRRDAQAMSGGVIEYRSCILPLLAVSHQLEKLTAVAEADQLAANMLLVLYGHQQETGFWYELTMPGDVGGGNARQHSWSTATPNDGIAVALTAVPLVIRYSWMPSAGG
jgi:hypothetical protein